MSSRSRLYAHLILPATYPIGSNMSKRTFYYTPCPLCLRDVDSSRPDCYRVLSPDLAYAGLINEKPRWEPGVTNPGVMNYIIVGDLKLTIYQDYPRLDYAQRPWLLHKRCLKLVRDLSIQAIYRLCDLVEPTSLSRSHNLPSVQGAFYNLPIRCDPCELKGAEHFGIHCCLHIRAETSYSLNCHQRSGL